MLFGLGVIILGGSLMGCANESTVEHHRETTADTSMTIQEALEKHKDDLMAVSGVQGTALGCSAEQTCIVVYALEKTAALKQELPDTLEGFPVKVVETGPIRALPPQQEDSSQSQGGGS